MSVTRYQQISGRIQRYMLLTRSTEQQRAVNIDMAYALKWHALSHASIRFQYINHIYVDVGWLAGSSIPKTHIELISQTDASKIEHKQK